MQLTENFGFLAEHDVGLMNLAALAERYFRDDPPTAGLPRDVRRCAAPPELRAHGAARGIS